MDYLRLQKGIYRSAALATGIIVSAQGFAQVTPPDAGQTLRETRPPAALPPRTEAPKLVIPDEKDVRGDQGQSVLVRTIRIEGAVSIPVEELKALVVDIEGKTVTLGQLREAARRITTHYRERGYVVARAFVPAQEVDDGNFLIRVLEGTLVSGRIENRSAVNEPVLQSVLDAQDLNGKVIASSTTDRGLLLLADLPSVGKVSGKLKPGQTVGTSDLIVAVDAGKRVEGLVSLDNYGNRYTGENRLNGQVAFNSPTGRGDRIALMGTVTDESLLYGRAAYDLPVTGNGLRAGAAVSTSSYELGQEFANLDATGTAITAGVFVLYPMVRGLNWNVWFTGNVEHRKLEDEIKSVSSVTEKSADVGTVELYGDVVDAVGGGGYSTWRVSAVVGDLSIDTAAALEADRFGPRTNGSYQKLMLSASRLQAITENTSLALSLNGQFAGKNLDSSEKFLAGGIYGARAYPQGEGAGDEGWLGSLELRHKIMNNLQLGAFYDVGHVDISQNPYIVEDNDTDLRSYGLTLTAGHGAVSGKLTVAWRAGTDPATTAPDRDPRVWGSLGYNF